MNSAASVDRARLLVAEWDKLGRQPHLLVGLIAEALDEVEEKGVGLGARNAWIAGMSERKIFPGGVA